MALPSIHLREFIDMPGRGIGFNDNTWAALKELADITNVKAEDRFTGLIQDALRVYEWVIYQQANGHKIASLESADIQALEQSPLVHGTREILEPVFPSEKTAKALEYFHKVAA
jgi:hypothetical protein